MSLRIGVCAVIIMFSIGFEEDPSIGPVRQYENVSIDAYPQGLGTTINFEFDNPYNDSVTLTLRLSNLTYHRALIYTQAYQPTLRISRAINVPSFLCDGSNLRLFLIASGKGFLIEKSLFIYPVKSIQLQPPLGQYDNPIPSRSTINEQGTISYMYERFHFINFLDMQTNPTYGKVDLRNLMMQVLAPIPFVMTIDTFYLLVPNHPHFEAFPLYQSHYRKLELEKSGQATMVFQFKNMYVHPQMKTIAPLQYPGYVPTAMLFLPIPLFAELNRLPMVIHMHFRLVHHYTIAYEFMFEAMRPMLGHCGDSVYCVRLYHD